MLSRQQKAIIRKIAILQQESLMVLATEMVEDIWISLINDGYAVSKTEVLEAILKQLEVWDRLHRSPDLYHSILDNDQDSLLRHHLFNEFDGDDAEIRGLWRNIIIRERINKDLN